MKNIKKMVVLGLICMFITPSDANNMSYWEQIPITTKYDLALSRTGGEGFQMVESLGYATSEPNVMYLSTNTSQVWKSIDGGKNWKLARNGIITQGVASLVVSPNDPNMVFAAGTYGAAKTRIDKYPLRIEGIYRTTDGGESWEMQEITHFNTTSNKGRLFAFIKSGDSEYNVFAGTYEDGLLASYDLGTNWHVINENLKKISDLAPDPSNSDVLYIASEAGLYRYEKEKFFRIGTGLLGRPLSIAISNDETGRIWVTVEGFGLYVSKDKGQTFLSSNLHGVVVIGVSPVNSNLLLAKRNQSRWRKPLVSYDGGITWDISGKVEILDPDYDKRGDRFWFSAPFAFHPEKENVIFTVSNGRGRILKSIDSGRTWSFSGSGFTGARMIDMATLPDGGMIFCYADHGLWISKTDEKGPYKFLNPPKVNKLRSCSAVATNGKILVAAIGSWNEQVLVVSNDLGKSWKTYNNTPAYHRYISFDPLDTKYIYSGYYLSSDEGKSWNKIGYEIRAVDKHGWLYALTSDMRDKSRVLISKDKGTTWEEMVGSIPISIDRIHDIAVYHNKKHIVYLGTSIGVFILEGNKWRLSNENNNLRQDEFGMTYVNNVYVDPNDSRVIYVGRRSPGLAQSNGVFISTDSGDSWRNITNNLGPYLSIWAIESDYRTNSIYIGTSLGTFRLNGISD